MNADDIFEMIQPFIAALIGGGMTLLATFLTFKRTSKAAVQTERRKLSHDSAREITTQLALAAGIARQHREPESLDLTKEGQDKMADCLAAMTHHAGYIDDEILQASVDEAIDFLRPPPKFEIYLARPVPSIVAALQRWLGPMVQAHILDQAMPEEPDFLTEFRETYQDVLDEWEAYVEFVDQKRAEKREAQKAQKAADIAAQTSADLT